jgi:hypothetical protein
MYVFVYKYSSRFPLAYNFDEKININCFAYCYNPLPCTAMHTVCNNCWMNKRLSVAYPALKLFPFPPFISILPAFVGSEWISIKWDDPALPLGKFPKFHFKPYKSKVCAEQRENKVWYLLECDVLKLQKRPLVTDFVPI